MFLARFARNDSFLSKVCLQGQSGQTGRFYSQQNDMNEIGGLEARNLPVFFFAFTCTPEPNFSKKMRKASLLQAILLK